MNTMRHARFLAVLAVLAGLAVFTGCSAPYASSGMGYNNGGNSGGSGGTSYAISGTITLTNLGASGYAYVTATFASYPYPTSVLVPMAIGSANAAVSGSYQVNGGTVVSDPPARTGMGPYTWTMTISNLSVSANVQIDAAMN